MVKNKLSSQFVILIFMSLLAISLPLSTRLVQQSQDQRSHAAETSTSQISFKIAFKGIKPSANCLGLLKNVKVEIANVSTNNFQSNVDASITPAGGETNNNGDQVFLVSKLNLDSKFNSLNNFNYIRVKDSTHLASRMCLDNQNTKLDEVTTCDISLKNTNTTVYNFSNYPLLSGDINQDGMVNSSDYSLLKNNFNNDVQCGLQGDLNYDGIVNSLDSGLLKDSLSTKEDGKSGTIYTITNTPTPTQTHTPTQTTTPTQTPTPTLTPTPTNSNIDYITFSLTFYSSLPIENGGYADMACGGKIADVKKVIYVANNVYPCGTKIYLEGYGVMTVQDRGGKGFNSKTRLDVLIPRNAGESDKDYFKRVNDKGRPSVRGYIIK